MTPGVRIERCAREHLRSFSAFTLICTWTDSIRGGGHQNWKNFGRATNDTTSQRKHLQAIPRDFLPEDQTHMSTSRVAFAENSGHKEHAKTHDELWKSGDA